MSVTTKSFCSIVLVICLVLCFCTSALAYNETYLVHTSGYLAPGATVTGEVHPTLGRYMGIIVGTGLVNAPNGVTSSLNFYMYPIDRNVSATNVGKAELIWEGTLPSDAVTGGNTYFLRNNSNYNMAYTLAIIERWD